MEIVYKKNLDNKEKAFINEYLIDLDPERAAKAAGYANSMARTKAYGWVSNSKQNTKPHLYQALIKKLNKRNEKLDITAERVLLEYKRMGFADPRKVMSWDNEGVYLKGSDSLTDDEAAIISEVSYKETKDGMHVSVKMHDKKDPLDKLAKFTGLLDGKEPPQEVINYNWENLTLEEKLALKKASTKNATDKE